ncbi:PREDICTED: whirlin-like [Amphimedon queenslandica]|uniref:PDZ domain-containing protein n=1 Tax=Amphimedon queenslandica TaxID=400682 RepID=A0AAN0IKZ1_AMPQE|nr:PREDICTED: whirlin-like [Amphimedon queenslandica]|eukprot:XP_011402656.1 PREDICTED: whirlin-like [Amphimedon queenslandica]
MATYSSHTLPSRGGGGGGRFYRGSAGLMEKIHEMLTERECSIFNEGLAAYHKRRDVSRFVESLSLVLNTNGKRQLLVPIRNQFIKPTLPLKGNTAKSGKKMFNKTQTGPKVLEIKRDEKGEWGFSIRGGIDHGMKAGLKVGDYIHRVNEVGLEGLTFAQATQIFRNHSKIRMVIMSYERIPGFQFANKYIRWVDREGKPVLPPTEIESLGMTSGGHVDPNQYTSYGRITGLQFADLNDQLKLSKGQQLQLATNKQGMAR